MRLTRVKSRLTWVFHDPWLNQAKQAGASLQKILDETPGDVKDRLPNDFPPTARMKPTVKLHSQGFHLEVYSGQFCESDLKFQKPWTLQVVGIWCQF